GFRAARAASDPMRPHGTSQCEQTTSAVLASLNASYAKRNAALIEKILLKKDASTNELKSTLALKRLKLEGCAGPERFTHKPSRPQGIAPSSGGASTVTS